MITLPDLLTTYEALPVLVPDPCGPSMSKKLLVQRGWGDWAIAHLQRWPDYPEGGVTWILAGPDGYDAPDITAWTDLPPKEIK